MWSLKTWVCNLLLVLAVAALGVEANSVNTKADTRIVGGTTISITEAPYQVSIRLKSNDKKFGQGHLCGGALISSRLILTAAHCIYNEDKKKYRDAKEFTVVLANERLSVKSANALQFDVQTLIVHQNYNNQNFNNDIALIFINGVIKFSSPSVREIKLQDKPLAVGTNCTVTGWGKTAADGSGSVSDFLLRGTVPIYDPLRCSQAYNRTLPGMICAGLPQGGVDACQGDSGGPLVSNNNVTGIVSWGTGCGQAGFPGVYTDVPSFYNWIVSQNMSLNYTYIRGGSMSYHTGSKAFLGITGLLVFVVSSQF